jgi:hypothetical protein
MLKSIPANQEAQSSSAFGCLPSNIGRTAKAKLAAFPEAGEHEADGTSFERDAEFCDAQLLALALRSCLRSGIDPSKHDHFFCGSVWDRRD